MTKLNFSADIATLFLDAGFCIERFTPPIARLLNLRATDVGRPFRDLAQVLEDERLLTDCQEVLKRAVALLPLASVISTIRRVAAGRLPEPHSRASMKGMATFQCRRATIWCG